MVNSCNYNCLFTLTVSAVPFFLHSPLSVASIPFYIYTNSVFVAHTSELLSVCALIFVFPSSVCGYSCRLFFVFVLFRCVLCTHKCRKAHEIWCDIYSHNVPKVHIQCIQCGKQQRQQ